MPHSREHAMLSVTDRTSGATDRPSEGKKLRLTWDEGIPSATVS